MQPDALQVGLAWMQPDALQVGLAWMQPDALQVGLAWMQPDALQVGVAWMQPDALQVGVHLQVVLQATLDKHPDLSSPCEVSDFLLEAFPLTGVDSPTPPGLVVELLLEQPLEE